MKKQAQARLPLLPFSNTQKLLQGVTCLLARAFTTMSKNFKILLPRQNIA